LEALKRFGYVPWVAFWWSNQNLVFFSYRILVAGKDMEYIRPKLGAGIITGSRIFNY